MWFLARVAFSINIFTRKPENLRKPQQDPPAARHKSTQNADSPGTHNPPETRTRTHSKGGAKQVVSILSGALHNAAAESAHSTSMSALMHLGLHASSTCGLGQSGAPWPRSPQLTQVISRRSLGGMYAVLVLCLCHPWPRVGALKPL